MIWLRWFYSKIYYEHKYKKNHLLIKYMASFSECVFGIYNTLYPETSLYKVTLGDLTYVGDKSRICNASIGKYCCIAPEVLIGLGKHPSRDFISTHPAFYSTACQSQIAFAEKTYFNEEISQTNIGNNVWIGARVIIVGGISIGDGAIIAAGSVVTKDIPSYAIFGGVPAKLLRYRFTQEQIKKLTEIPWWDKDIEWLKQNHKLLHDIANVNELYKNIKNICN